MKIVLKIIDYACPMERNENIMYFHVLHGGRFYFSDFNVSDSYKFHEYAELNYHIFVKRMKMNEFELKKYLFEDDGYFLDYFAPLFKK